MDDTIDILENIEIVDLQEPSLGDTANLTVDGFSFDDDLFGSFLPDESLYSRYLYDEITFDELMRQVHHNETYSIVGDGKNVSINRDNSDPDTTDSCDDSESTYYPPCHLTRKIRCPKALVNNVKGRVAKRGRPRNRDKRLPVELANYLGEAERCLNNDKFDEAEEICRNIIASEPRKAPPYVVLADIYYRKGNVDKANEYLFAAAIRNPNDVNIWMTLMDFAEEKDDPAVAIYYARLALRSRKKDVTLRQRLIYYCQKAGRSREALQLRLRSLTLNPEANGLAQFKVARSLADEFFKLMDPNSFIRAYEAAFEQFPQCGTDDDRNSALSMMVQLKKYESAFKFFLKFCGVSLTTSSRRQFDVSRMENELQIADEFTKCVYPSNMSSEMCMKLYVVLVRVGLATAATPHVLKSFTDAFCEEFSDWFIDIVKAYKAMRRFSTASTLLLRLTKFKKTAKLPLFWIMLAEVYVEQGMTDQAIDAYKHVIKRLSPRNAEVRITLGNLLRRLGRYREALELLNPPSVPSRLSGKSSAGREASKKRKKKSEDRLRSSAGRSTSSSTASSRSHSSNSSATVVSETEEEESDSKGRQQVTLNWITSIPNNALLCQDPLAYRLAYERCRMLEQDGTTKPVKFMDEAWQFLFADVFRICGSNWVQVAMFLGTSRFRSLLMDRLKPSIGSEEQTASTSSSASLRSASGVSDLDVWSLFLRLVDALTLSLPASLRHVETAAALGYLLPQVHRNDGRKQAVGNLMVSSCFLGRHGAPIFIHLKEVQKQWGHRSQYWNLVNLAITMSRNLRHCRYVERLFAREGSNLAVGILANNDCIVRGSHRYGICRLADLRDSYPTNPLLSLLLAVGFLSVALHKHIVSRHPAILQGFGFLAEYRQLRGVCQETYYNMGRACQQLMLNNAARHYYELVLNTEPVGETKEERALTDLRMEAAFNLALIYRSQKNFAMARHLIQTHLVVL